MTTEIKTLKKTLVYSAILGAGLAIPALIPNIMPFFTLFVLPFLSAIIVLTFMTLRKELTVNDLKDYAILGGIIGAVSGFSFLVAFCPLVILIHFFIKNYYIYALNGLNFFLTFTLLGSVMIIFLITNSAGGLLTGVLAKQFYKN